MRNRPYEEVKGDFIVGLLGLGTLMLIVMMAM